MSTSVEQEFASLVQPHFAALYRAAMRPSLPVNCLIRPNAHVRFSSGSDAITKRA